MAMNIQPQTIKNFSYPRRFVRGIASRSLAPLILLECFVTGGRTIQAYKRGGYEEARERFTEESIGAAFWFADVKMFNKMNDFIGKKVLNLSTTDFDAVGDGVRKPLNNFLHDENLLRAEKSLNDKKALKTLTKNQIAVFKALKIGSSILLANVLVGLVVPKINQHITNVQRVNKKQEKEIKKPTNYVSMDNFAVKEDNKKKDISFGAMNYNTLLTIADKFENNSTYQLLSTDVGIAGGRAVSARNKHERTEVLFRDLTSIYFYMFSMPNINRWLNQIEDGRKTRLDPVAAKQVTDLMDDVLKENGGKMKVEDFSRAVMGNNNNVGYINKDLLEMFGEHRVIKLDDFIKHLENNKQFNADQVTKYIDLAKRMSKLQPQVEGISMITKDQIKDVFREGAINLPEFLQNVFGIATGNASTKKYKFVGYSDLMVLKGDVVTYVETVIKKAKNQGGEVTADLLKKVCRENFIKNTFNWGVGFAVSAMFLSTFIPKIQYWITKKVTGSDAFPGTADYSNEKKS